MGVHESQSYHGLYTIALNRSGRNLLWEKLEISNCTLHMGKHHII